MGSTNNIRRRLQEHRLANHAGTRYSKHIKLLLVQEYDSVSQARKIEARIKKFKSRKILDKIIADGIITTDLGL